MPFPERIETIDRRRRLLSGSVSLALLAMWLGISPSRLRAQASREGTPVPIGVIGSGRIGGTVGGLWVKAGHPVLFSSRHPDELKPLVEKLGPLARAGTVAEALAFSNVIFLAVPYKALPEISAEYGKAFAGKVVVDATNAVRARDGAIAEEAMRKGIGITTAKYLHGARIVRAFNFMGATSFANQNHRAEGLIAVPIAADDPKALRIGEQLVRDAGFEPVVVGRLATADSFAPGGPLFHQIGSADAMRARMAEQGGKMVETPK
ncbi:NADPH-dependent F420 reductase [Cupriavidus basilensis]|uniref:NADPH-dependent F420 reductase n=1 Tax=Cupriavidus basilensis TaxID=68895 RepID=UPI0039F6B8A0